MAKKQKDEFDFGDDFDFDSGEFDFSDDMDGEFSSESKSNKRSAVTDVFSGTISGVKSKLKDPEEIGKMVRNSLPSEFDYAATEFSNTARTMTRAYDDAVKELKPQIGKIAKEVNRMIPENLSLVKKMSSKFDEWMNGPQFNTNRGSESQENQIVSNTISEIFGSIEEKNNEQRAQDKAEDKIKGAIDSKRFKTSTALLGRIADSSSKVSSMMETIGVGYMKKSLELNIRQLYTMQQLTEKTIRFQEVTSKQNETIVKNTALPEFVKLRESERFKELAKNKFYGNIQGKLLEGTGLNKTAERLAKDFKDYVDGLKMGFTAGADAAEMIRDQLDSLGELEGAGLGITKAGMAGQMLGGSIGGRIQKLITDAAKEALGEESKVLALGNKASTVAMNASAYAKRKRKDDSFQDKMYSEGPLGKMYEFMDYIMSRATDDDEDFRLKEGFSVSSLKDAGKITNKFILSVEEVIPTWLAHIHRELQMARTGANDLPVSKYDYKKASIITKSDAIKKITAKLDKESNNYSLKYSLNESYKELAGNSNVSEDVEKQLKQFILNISREKNTVYDRQGIEESSAYTKLSKEAKAVVDANLSRYSDIDDNSANVRNLTGKMLNTRESTTDMRSTIDALEQEYGRDALLEMGVIKEDEDGGYSIVPENYYKRVDEGALLPDRTSDKNKKKNIKTIPISKIEKYNKKYAKSDIETKENIDQVNSTDSSSKSFLSRLLKTKVFTWNYKKGEGDQDDHIGPMAQDVQKNMGDSTAPGGKKIDLVNLNGINMAATQELASKVAGLKVENSTNKDYLAAIVTNTYHTAEALTNGNFFKVNMPKFDFSAIDFSKIKIPNITIPENAKIIIGDVKEKAETFIGKAKELGKEGASKVGDIALGTTKLAGKGVVGAGKGALGAANWIWDVMLHPSFKFLNEKETKEAITQGLGRAIKGTFNLASGILGKVKQTLTESIPDALKSAKKKLTKFTQFLYEGVEGIQDLYIKGKEEPVILANRLRAGEYFDGETGKVINTVREVEQAEGDIKDSRGNIVVTLSELKEGLFNKHGKLIKSKSFGLSRLLLATGAKIAGGAFKLAGSAAGKVGSFLGLNDGRFDALKQSFSEAFQDFNLTGFNSRANDAIIDIRNLLFKVHAKYAKDLPLTDSSKDKSSSSNKDTTKPGFIKSLVNFATKPFKGKEQEELIENIEAAPLPKDESLRRDVSKEKVLVDTSENIGKRAGIFSSIKGLFKKDLNFSKPEEAFQANDNSLNAAASKLDPSVMEHSKGVAILLKDAASKLSKGEKVNFQELYKNVEDDVRGMLKGLDKSYSENSYNSDYILKVISTMNPEIGSKLSSMKDTLVTKLQDSKKEAKDTSAQDQKDLMYLLHPEEALTLEKLKTSGKADPKKLLKYISTLNKDKIKKSKLGQAVGSFFSKGESAKDPVTGQPLSSPRYQSGSILDKITDKLFSKNERTEETEDADTDQTDGRRKPSVWERAKHKYSNSKIGTKTSERYDKLKNSRVGRMGSRIGNSRLGSLVRDGVSLAGKGIKGAASLGKGLLGMFNTPAAEGSDDTGEVHSGRDFRANQKELSVNASAVPSFNDKDGDGRREGSYEDILAKMNSEKEERLKKKDLQKAENKFNNENTIDRLTKLIGNNISSISDKITDMVDSVLGDGSDMLDDALDNSDDSDDDALDNSGDSDDKDKKNKKKGRRGRRGKGRGKGPKIRTPKGKDLKNAKKAADVANKASKAKKMIDAANTANKISRTARIANTAKNIFTAARVGMAGYGLLGAGAATAGTTAGAATVGATAGAATAATAATAGTAVTGGAAAAGVAAGGALLGTAAAVIGVGLLAAGVLYGGYKLYKYLTRNNADDFEMIRIYQYGLGHTDDSLKNVHKVLGLESYLLDKRTGYDKDRAFILEKKVIAKEVFELFDIDPKDIEAQRNFQVWYRERFLPVYLYHASTVTKINSKKTLEDLKSLTNNEIADYLDKASFKSTPYNVVVSPFKNTDVLNTDPKYVEGLISKLKDKYKNLKGSDKKAYQKAILDEIDLKKAEGILTDYEKEKFSTKPTESLSTKMYPSGVNNPTGVELKSQGEDGPQRDLGTAKPAPGDTNSSISYSPSNLPIAKGDLKDGSGAAPFIVFNKKDVKIDSMNPVMKRQLLGMIQEYGEMTGKKVIITSGTRTTAEQAELFKRLGSGKAAEPGKSLHEFGVAVDINTADVNEMDRLGLMRKYGFTRPVSGETWHVEPIGIQGSISDAKTDPNKASELIAAGAGYGGGGIGSIKGSKLGGRDPNASFKVMQANSSAAREEAVKDKSSELPSSSGLLPTSDNKAQGSSSSGKSVSSFGSTIVPQGLEGMMNTGLKANSVLQSYSGNNENGTAQVPKDNIANSMSEVEPSSFGSGNLQGGTPASGKVEDVIVDASKKVGMDPSMMQAFAAIESSMNPNAAAKTSSAKGLYQFLDATWKEQVSKNAKKHGLSPSASRFDPYASTIIAGEYLKSNLNYVKKVKPNTNIVDGYLTHFLGPGGARTFLSANPSAIAAQVMPKAASANKSIFYDGSRPRTIAQVYKLLQEKITKKAKSFGISLGSTGSLDTGNKASKDSSEIGITGDSPTAGYSGSVSAAKPQSLVDSSQSATTVSYQAPASTPSFTRVDPVVDTSYANSSTDSYRSGEVKDSSMSALLDVNNRQLEVFTQMFELLKAELPKMTTMSSDKGITKETQVPKESRPGVSTPRVQDRKMEIPNPAVNLGARPLMT